MAVAGAAFSAYQQKKSADNNMKVAENNAQLARMQAADATSRAAYDARKIEIAGRRIGNEARVAIEAGGIDSTSGSAANLITASNMNAAADAQRTIANARRVAWGLENEADDTMLQGRFNKESGYMSALGTGLGGVGQGASAYAASRRGK